MHRTQKRLFGGLGILVIMAVGIVVLNMPLLAFIASLMVLMFSLSED